MNPRCYIGLGANLGRPLETFRRAIGLLTSDGRITLHDQSSLYRTAAVGGPADQPDYLNAVICAHTGLLPAKVLERLLDIERGCGRQRAARWAARALDLDVLLYDEQIIETAQLTVPHPRLHERLFVLAPLADLAPDLVHPVTGHRIREMRAALAAEGQQRVTCIAPAGWL